ncbi:MAG: DUF1801 domain-containing protein [Spirochaetia bacterium]|nr:DUF1801 domain-containing protein [Spirochaetia bacterium]
MSFDENRTPGINTGAKLIKWLNLAQNNDGTLSPKKALKKSVKTKLKKNSSEELYAIFNELKKMISKYENRLFPKNDNKDRYELWSRKDIIIENRKRKEVYFAGIIKQKSYVGFYYMPVYVDTSLKDVFQPELLSLLKGKSCFHIKKLDSTIKKQIKFALKTGFSLYKKRGWV